jgi:hypothetical protein
MNSTIFVLFNKYCSIVDQLGSKDSSRDFQLNCVISFFTYIYYFMHRSKDWCDGESEKILTLMVHLNEVLAVELFPLLGLVNSEPPLPDPGLTPIRTSLKLEPWGRQSWRSCSLSADEVQDIHA